MKDCGGLRILHFTYALQGGGAEQQLRYFLGCPSSACLTQAVCCGNDEGKETYPSHLPVYCIPKKSRYDMRWQLIRKTISEYKPDLIHCWLPSLLWSCLPPALSCGKPVLASYRLANRLNNISELAHLAPPLFTSALTSNTSPLNFPYDTIFKLKSGTYIPNAVDLIPGREAKPIDDEAWCSDDRFRFLFAGRLDRQKRPDLVLEAFTRIPNLNSRLILCGTGALEEELKELSGALGISERTTYLGYRTDLARVMKSCHSLVQASDNEGMPNTVFEAMSCRLPVIVSDIPQHTRWVETDKNGLVFTAGDSQSLQRMMSAALTASKDKQRSLTEQAYKGLSELSITRMVERYLDVYARLL